MRIALLTSQFPGVRMGGIGGYTVATARALAAIGHEVHLFTGPLPAEALNGVGAGVRVHAVADLAERVSTGAVVPGVAVLAAAGGEAVHRLGLGVLLADAFLREHRAGAFDVVEGPEYEALALPLLWRLRGMEPGARPAVVTQIHSGSAINRCGNDLPTGEADAVVDAIERAAIGLADAVSAPTEAVVRESRRLLGIERGATILPLAVVAEGAFTLPPKEGAVVFVGRIERLKGTDVLCEAAISFLRACAGARVRFVGPDTPTAPADGTGERSMRAWIERRLPGDVRARVEFTGEVPPGEALEEMRRARFVVGPSLFENFSLVAAQAMGLGRPVICTEGIGTVEVIGETGLTFPRGDAGALARQMERLWNSESLLQELALAAHERAATQFSASVLAAKRAAMYVDAVAGKRSRAADWMTAEHALVGSLIAMTCGLCGIEGAADSPGVRLLAVMEAAAAAEGRPCAEVLLYGAGKYSARVLAEQAIWTSAGHAVVGFVDDGARWADGGMHLGLPVVGRERVLAQLNAGERVPAIVLCTDTFEEQLWEKTAGLRAAGAGVYRLSVGSVS